LRQKWGGEFAASPQGKKKRKIGNGRERFGALPPFLFGFGLFSALFVGGFDLRSVFVYISLVFSGFEFVFLCFCLFGRFFVFLFSPLAGYFLPFFVPL
jgi:hypothetical protein